MIPHDAPAADWNLYYHNTYMNHIAWGPCRIRVQHQDNGGQHLQAATISKKGGEYKKVSPKDLQIMWPRPGAYNFPRVNGAGFIGRTPQRHMKRSAYNDHYYIQWSPVHMTSDQMMIQIVSPAPHTTLHKFTRVSGGIDVENYSAAMSNKVILYYSGNKAPAVLIYMAEEIGYLDKDTLIPYMPDDSRLLRIQRHLSTIGIT